jgi:diadenosine tetraphosphatase ApaH/serine/threonine PP2A family protein phosphatase
VFLGDLVDKGPDSPGVVRFIRQLRDTTNVVLVMGNHESKHKRLRKKVAAGDLAGALAMKHGEDILDIVRGMDADDIEFLDSGVYYHQEGGYTFVHAGIPPGISDLPIPQPDMSGRTLKNFELFTFVRYVDRVTGRALSLGEEKKGDPYWASTYDGRFGKVVFGHQPWLDGPRVFPHAVGIDTGAVHGHGLTAFVSQDGVESLHTVQSEEFIEFYKLYPGVQDACSHH